jgi:hypothetical protein
VATCQDVPTTIVSQQVVLGGTSPHQLFVTGWTWVSEFLNGPMAEISIAIDGSTVGFVTFRSASAGGFVYVPQVLTVAAGTHTIALRGVARVSLPNPPTVCNTFNGGAVGVIDFGVSP